MLTMSNKYDILLDDDKGTDFLLPKSLGANRFREFNRSLVINRDASFLLEDKMLFQKGNTIGSEYRFKKGNKFGKGFKKGCKLSAESRQKISEKLKGRKLTKEHKKKLSEAQKEFIKNNPLALQIRFQEGNIPWNKNKKLPQFSGIKSPSWKGGTISREGYRSVYQPNHPFSSNRKYVQEHRLVMEQMLGRYLTKNEVVHHINGIRYDNRPENLKLVVKGKNWHPKTCPKCKFEFLIK